MKNCPSCKRRKTLREHQGVMDTFERYIVHTWQCIYCGGVFEFHALGNKLKRIGTERIILAPNELAQLRDARNIKEVQP